MLLLVRGEGGWVGWWVGVLDEIKAISAQLSLSWGAELCNKKSEMTV